MPITITPSAPGAVWGPGIPFIVQSDAVGPFPTGAFWQLDARTHPDERVIGQYVLPYIGNAQEGNWYLHDGSATTSNVAWAPQEGDLVDITAKLMQDPTTQVDAGTLAQQQWKTTDASWVLEGGQQGQVQGGFTAEDRATLQQTQQATTDIEQFVQRTVQTVTGLVLESPIGGIIAHPDIHLLNFWNPSFVLRGRGVLDGNPTWRFTAYYGIVWQVTQHPPGAGVFDGFIQEWTIRVAQFVMLHFNKQTTRLYAQQVHDTSLDTGAFFWDEYAPYQFGYDITEGWELTCQWFYL